MALSSELLILENPALVILLVSVLIDLILGEPPTYLHPVVWMGEMIDELEKVSGNFGYGAPIVLVPATVFGGGTVMLVGSLKSIVPTTSPVLVVLLILVSSYILKSTFSVSMLIKSARKVSDFSESDIERARDELKALAGRESSSLSPGGIRSAVVESLAENFVDGFLTPLFYFTLFLPLGVEFGVGGAMGYKAVNTADSMVGYREKGRKGWASARLDDALNFVPSRLSVPLISVSTFSLDAFTKPIHESRKVGSPNSGYPMSSIAHGLGVKLVKTEHYSLGEGELPSRGDTDRSVRAILIASLITVLMSGGVALWF